MKSLLRVVVVGLVIHFGVDAAPVHADDAIVRDSIWEGALEVRSGVALRFVIHLTQNSGAEMTGTLDSLDEGFNGLNLSAIALDKSRLSFELKVSDATYEGKLNASGTESVGTWIQRGTRLPLTLMRKARATAEPKPVGPEQIWEGKLAVGLGLQLRIVARIFKTESGAFAGTFESPDQGDKVEVELCFAR